MIVGENVLGGDNQQERSILCHSRESGNLEIGSPTKAFGDDIELKSSETVRWNLLMKDKIQSDLHGDMKTSAEMPGRLQNFEG